MAYTSKARLSISSIAIGVVALLSWSCNSSTWSDPFASPPIGQKFVVPATIPADQTDLIRLNTPTLSRATFIKLTDRNNASLAFKSISLIKSQGSREIYTAEKIQQINSSPDCKSIEQDYADFFKVYPGIIVICGVEFTKALSESSGVVFTTLDAKDVEFTSWGTAWSEMNDYRVTVQSFSL